MLLLVSIDGTRSWVSDCTSFDPHDRFPLRLDSTFGPGLFSCPRTRLVHSSRQLAKYPVDLLKTAKEKKESFNTHSPLHSPIPTGVLYVMAFHEKAG